MNPRYIKDVIEALPRPCIEPLLPPEYIKPGNNHHKFYRHCNVGLTTESMKHHLSNEGHEIFAALEYAGYKLAGHNISPGLSITHVPSIINTCDPITLVIQDKREWESRTAERLRDAESVAMKFLEVGVLKDNPNIFKLTLLKDAHQQPLYHREAMNEISCHAVVVYYHPRIVAHLAPYVRSEHLIRTYHTVESTTVPAFVRAEDRRGCILSGAVSGAYPLRQKMVEYIQNAPRCARDESPVSSIDYLKHPGYHQRGCETPKYLQTLSRYRVAICTSSIYGYALRKHIEATAAGCIVITDLPIDDVLPKIDGNMVRVNPNTSAVEVAHLVDRLCASYDEELQRSYAKSAIEYYDYKAEGIRLAEKIEEQRNSYPSRIQSSQSPQLKTGVRHETREG